MTKKDNNSMLELDIQDIISGRFLIPHHNGLGLPTPDADCEVNVRCIDTELIIHVRPGQKLSFKPGGKNSNIECIRTTCTLLNDLLPDDLHSRLPENPSSVTISINEWLQYIRTDTIPTHWFIVHREAQIFKINIEIVWNKDESIYIESGTSWENALTRVNKWVTANEMKKDTNSLKKKKDYSNVVSPPCRKQSITKNENVVDDKKVNDFLISAKDIFK